jgi:hypothetical protein
MAHFQAVLVVVEVVLSILRIVEREVTGLMALSLLSNTSKKGYKYEQ